MTRIPAKPVLKYNQIVKIRANPSNPRHPRSIPKGDLTMIAFVFTGGGSSGPLQAGAVRALLESNIIPDMVVGTSAGALNAVFLAAHGPTLDAYDRLAQAWTGATKRKAMPGGYLGAFRRLIFRADSLFESSGLRTMLETELPPAVRTFGDLKIPCYITASDLRSRRLFLFGEEPGGPLIEAALASSAIPGVYPPIDYHGLQLVDGGVVDNVPASVAMDKGATTLYLINVGYGGQTEDAVKGVIPIVDRAIGVFLAESLYADLNRADLDPTIDLHHIQFPDFADVGLLDFDQTAAMLTAGYRITLDYLKDPHPRNQIQPLKSMDRPDAPIPGIREIPRRRP